jgi:hypothetical protein
VYEVCSKSLAAPIERLFNDPTEPYRNNYMGWIAFAEIPPKVKKKPKVGRYS